MIDHLLRFPDEATAIADPVVGAYHTPANDDGPGGWRGDVCIPNISCKQISTGKSLDGWRINIASTTQIASLMKHAALEIVFDDDIATKNGPFIVFSIYSGETLADLSLSPYFAGRATTDLMAKSPVAIAIAQTKTIKDVAPADMAAWTTKSIASSAIKGQPVSVSLTDSIADQPVLSEDK